MTKRNIQAKPAPAAKAKGGKFKHWVDGTSPYFVHKQQSREGQLITVGAMVAAGLAKMNKNGLAKSTKGDAKLFRAIAGDTAWSYHRSHKRIDTETATLTSVGVAFIGARLKSQDDIDMVNAIAAAIAKGGKVEGLAVEFAYPVVIK